MKKYQHTSNSKTPANQVHNKEGTPITEWAQAEVPATAHPEQQEHQKSAEIIGTIRSSTSAGSTATAKTPTLARLQVTDRMSVNVGHWKQQGHLVLLTAGMPGRVGMPATTGTPVTP